MEEEILSEEFWERVMLLDLVSPGYKQEILDIFYGRITE